MATSSMHKPGWRSRRRSRLSLVERAVPRLGRPAEDGAKKTPSAVETPTSPDSKSPTISEVGTKLVLNGDPSPVQIQGQPRKDSDQASDVASSAAVAVLEQALEYASVHAGDDDDRATPAHEEIEAADETAAPYHSAEKPSLAAIETETSPTQADNAPSVRASSDMETLPADEAQVSLPLAEASAAATSLVARNETEKVDVARPSEQTSPASPKLELDWDSLIDSGFTDPRDRSRPLSKNMDEIIRALIRQALSDQSSWRDRVILVTSPYERAGKTTAAINFAFGLTTVANHRAVLVDVDTSGPGAVDRLGGNELTGITSALADESIELDQVVIKTDLERLTLVASGAGDDETLDRFASRRMLQILRHLTENPDTILVIDAPPILLSQEAAVLSVIAGQVVMAVEAGTTTADQIEHALQRIGDRHNVSLVLNECSGIVPRDMSEIARRHESVMANRRTPGIKRRLPKAAAAGAFVLSLLVMPPVGQTGSNSALFARNPATSTRTVLPPERWSVTADANLVICRRMCR